ncbi:hypothetical protein TU87_22425 [Pseudomonas weihenstephanensis]|nr:hypothetical protein TU87_22425 [Pseudomonas weihenstephanensis]
MHVYFIHTVIVASIVIKKHGAGRREEQTKLRMAQTKLSISSCKKKHATNARAFNREIGALDDRITFFAQSKFECMSVHHWIPGCCWGVV